MDPQPEEYELALRAREGDREALTALVERTRLRLFSYAYSRLRHYEDAQDAVAAALLQVCRHVTELRQPERIHAWMHAIVRNEVRQLRRGRNADLCPLDDVPDCPDGAEPSLLKLEIECALLRLPESPAAALRLFYLEEVSIREIACRLRCSEGTVKSWLHRGRRLLAAEMEEQMPETPTRTAAVIHADLKPALVRRITSALRDLGYAAKVLKPADLSRLVESVKQYHYVVLDEWIGGRPALEFVLHMKSHTQVSWIPTCLLCDAPSEFTATAAWVAGVDRLLDKSDPAEIDRLADGLKQAVTVPDVLPLIPVRDCACFSPISFPLYIGREGSVSALRDAQTRGRFILLVAQKDREVNAPGPQDLYEVGSAVRIEETLAMSDESVRLDLKMRGRVRILEYLQTDPFLKARVEVVPDVTDVSPEARDLIEDVKARYIEAARAGRVRGLNVRLGSIHESGFLADVIAPCLNLAVAEQQALLEIPSVRDRLERVRAHLTPQAPGPA